MNENFIEGVFIAEILNWKMFIKLQNSLGWN